MSQQIEPIQPSDFQAVVITGTTGGVTGGELIPAEYEGVVHDISYTELGTLGTQEVVGSGSAIGPGVTGSRVTVSVVPSGTNLDVKTIGPNASFAYGEARRAVFGRIPRSNVLQVTTSVGNVAVRVVYTIEYSRYA